MRTRTATSLRPVARVLVGAAAVGGGLLLTALPASAHIEIAESEQPADAYAVLTFGVNHGCDGSPTSKMRIQLPEEIPTATPTVNPNWDISVVKETLDTPIDLGEGRSLTERITEIDYIAKAPLPGEFRDDLKLSVHIPADAAGTTLAFPTIQECAEGSTEWTMIAADGQDPEELEHPAPIVNVVAATGEGHHDEGEGEGDEVTTTAADSSVAAADSDSDDSGSSNGLAAAGLVAGVVGILLGGGALVVSRSKGSAGGGSAA